MHALLRLVGALCTVAAGTGAGVALWAKRRADHGSVQAFAALLSYLLTAIRYQAAPCDDLLRRAAQQPRFAQLGLVSCGDFAALPIPEALGTPLQSESRAVFAALGSVPRQRACELLEHLLTMCREREQALGRRASEAGSLYPRLGFCAGVLAVLILL